MESSVSVLRIVGRNQFPSVCSRKTEFSEMVPELALDSRRRNKGRDYFVHIFDWVFTKISFLVDFNRSTPIRTVKILIGAYQAVVLHPFQHLPLIQRLDRLREFTSVKCESHSWAVFRSR